MTELNEQVHIEDHTLVSEGQDGPNEAVRGSIRPVVYPFIELKARVLICYPFV